MQRQELVNLSGSQEKNASMSLSRKSKSIHSLCGQLWCSSCICHHNSGLHGRLMQSRVQHLGQRAFSCCFWGHGNEDTPTNMNWVWDWKEDASHLAANSISCWINNRLSGASFSSFSCLFKSDWTQITVAQNRIILSHSHHLLTFSSGGKFTSDSLCNMRFNFDRSSL